MMHEMGHHYNFSESIISSKKWDALYAEQGKKYFYDNVSLYATTNSSEAFAESFAMFTAPNYKIGTLPKEIEDVFKVLK